MVKISIRIGGSCGGRYSRPVAGITTYENRILQNSEHSYFWIDSKFCIDNKIYLIVNIDTYMTGSRWQPTNQQLRDFTIATKNQLKSYGANKTNCRFTFDNESDEYLNENFESYFNYVRVIHDALNSEFDLGAGNFRTARMDWYNTLGSKFNQGYYEVLDVHFQDGMNDEAGIMSIASKFSDINTGWGINRIAVTEGNNFWNVSTQRGHDLVKFQINTAENIGCEDFCFAFTNWTSNSEEGHGHLTYCVNDNPISYFWQDMKNIILQKKPIEIIEELENMKLQILKIGSVGNQVQWLQEILAEEYGFENSGGYDGKFGSITDAQVKAYQTANNLIIDGKVGKQTTFDLIWKANNFGKDYWFKKLQIYMAFN